MRKINMLGQKFGRMTVVSEAGRNKHGEVLWKCLCDCGNKKIVPGYRLRNGITKSCGCLAIELTKKRHTGQTAHNRKDLTGKRFGRLVVISYSYTDKHRKAHWDCECDCGNEAIVGTSNLLKGKAQSCGCLNKEILTKVNKVDMAGQKFGRLTPLETVGKNKHGEYLWNCLCDCGRYSIVSQAALASQNTQSCGHCGLYRNGKRASKQQIKLAELLNVPEEYINYPVGNKYIDIALVEQKIAIEYDSWYWHAHKQREDDDRAIELIDQGWKVLSIKSNTKLPDQQSLDWAILQLSPMTPYKELTLPEWGNGDTKYVTTR